ncbi:MAG: RNase adapter RapZ [Firmicutes bacterium]|nr:RNase adapter RapZ [Bacillota bacterium]
MDVIIVSGLSGAGRTMAANCLEDLGYYCVDNMPPALLSNFVELCEEAKEPIEKACFVIDARGGGFFNNFKASLDGLRERGIAYRILFLEASDAVLIRRYNASRRGHPMARGGTVEEGIARDRERMSDVRAMADFVIDTSNMKQVNLNEAIQNALNPERTPKECTITVQSFGYKHGVPLDADVIFDMRFLPNPYYVPSLKDKTGNNKQVQEYVFKAPEAKDFLDKLESLLDAVVPAFIREGKYNLTICFGCTGGHHRSVAMANAFKERLEATGHHVVLIHRDL